MDDITNFELFALLTKHSKATDKELQNAYNKFVRQVENINQPQGDYLTIYRLLNSIRIELISLRMLYKQE